MSTLDLLWPWLLGVLDVSIALLVSAHIVLTKRDDRSAIAWITVVWLSPFAGAAAYALFGINRIKRRALRLRRPKRRGAPAAGDAPQQSPPPEPTAGAPFVHFQSSLIRKFRHPPFTGGNRVEPLRHGDAAYPEMLAAIGAAKESVALSTYIFNDDPLGRRFVDALAEAEARGLAVRVLIDGVGALYSLPPVVGRLRRREVRAERFLASLLPWRMPYLNLRNHRKILVVDGRLGFTGGLNIKHGHLLADRPRWPTDDLHFRIDGPAVAQLMAVFADDWAFATGERLSDEPWFPPLELRGETVMRAIASGPHQEVGALRLTLLGALTQVRQRLRIATPYFLPDEEIVSLLSVVAVCVKKKDIVIPEASNQFYIKWAESASFPRLLEAGCRISLEPPPFDHAKFALADDEWVLFGSSNWDARSLRLNFEIDCECFDPKLARELEHLFVEKLARSRAVTLKELRARGLALRLRDGVARLFRSFL